MNKKENTITLSKWTPGMFITIGAILNIIFCSILAIIFPLALITIPAIVLNALLLIPRVDTRRYHAYWRVIPVVLTLILTTIIALAIFFVVTGLAIAYDAFANLIDLLAFWTKNPVIPDSSTWTWWLDITLIIFTACGVTGSVFISIGWYRKKELGQIVAGEPKTKEKPPKKEKKKEKKSA